MDCTFFSPEYGFNPLAGIRCFLTLLGNTKIDYDKELFQSPSGDSLFSDQNDVLYLQSSSLPRFNPLAGIRCFLTVSCGVTVRL